MLNYLICQRNFPVNELYDVPASRYVLPLGQLCNGSKSDRKCCDCNDDCLRFKTCCIDKLWNSLNPLPLQEYLKALVNETSKFKDTTYEKVFPLVPGSKTVYMLSTCIDNADQADIDGCLNKNSSSYEYNIPVFGNDNYLCKNSFCARCNSIENFEPVNLTANCVSSNVELSQFDHMWEDGTTTVATRAGTTTTKVKSNIYKNLEECSFDIGEVDGLKSVAPKYCLPQYHYNRSIRCQKPNENYKLCQSYHGFASAHGKEYANYHCYLCNSTNVEQAKNTPDLDCYEKDIPGQDLLPWSFTLSFSSQTSLGVYGPGYFKLDNFCQDKEFYNIITSKCEVFSCSSGYEKIGNTCHKVKTSKVIVIENASFNRCLIRDEVSFIYEMNTLLVNTTFLKNDIENFLNISLNSPFKKLFTSGNVSFLQSVVSIINTTLEKIYKILTQPNITFWKTVNILYISAITNHAPTMLYGVDLKHVFPGGRFCVDPVIEVSPQGNFTDTCSYQMNNVNTNYVDASLFLTIQPGQVRRTVSACSDSVKLY